MLLWTFPVLCKFTGCPVYCHFVSLSYLARLAVSVAVLRVCAGGFHGDHCIFSFSVTFIFYRKPLVSYIHQCPHKQTVWLLVSLLLVKKKKEKKWKIAAFSLIISEISSFFSSKISQSNWVNRGLKHIALVPVLPRVLGNELSSLAPHRHQFYGY